MPIISFGFPHVLFLILATFILSIRLLEDTRIAMKKLADFLAFLFWLIVLVKISQDIFLNT